jgi:hypothetical protein
LARFLREPRFSFAGLRLPLFSVEQFVADLTQADQVIQMVEFVPSVFVGAVMGLKF